MQTCKNCKTENPDQAKFCKNCGNNLKLIICPNCHKENDSDAQFCVECGCSLGIPRNLKLIEPESSPKPPENTKVKILDKVEKDLTDGLSSPQKENKLWNPLLTSLIVGGSMAVLIYLLTASVRGYALWQDFISNFFVFGLISSMVIFVRRRFIKKQVKSFKDPNSGGKAVLVFGIGLFIYFCILVLILISPIFRRIGQPAPVPTLTLVPIQNTPTEMIQISPSETPYKGTSTPRVAPTYPMSQEGWRFPPITGINHSGDEKSDMMKITIETFAKNAGVSVPKHWDIYTVTNGLKCDEFSNANEYRLNNLGYQQSQNQIIYISRNPNVCKISYSKGSSSQTPRFDAYYFEESGLLIVFYTNVS